MRELDYAVDPEDIVIQIYISLLGFEEKKSESTLRTLQDRGDSFIAREVSVLLEHLRNRKLLPTYEHQLAMGAQLHQDGFQNLVDLIGVDENGTDSEDYLQNGKTQPGLKRNIPLSPSTFVGGKISFDLTRISTLSFLLSPMPTTYKSLLSGTKKLFGELIDPDGPTWNLSRRDMLLVCGIRAASELFDCLKSVDVGLQLNVEFVVHDGPSNDNPRQGCKHDKKTTTIISRDLQTDIDYLLRCEKPLEALSSPLEDLQSDIDYMLRNMVPHESSRPLQDISSIRKETTPLPPSIKEDLINQSVVGINSTPEELQTDTDHMLRNTALHESSTTLLDTGLIAKESTPLPLSIEEELTKQQLGRMVSPLGDMKIDQDQIPRIMIPGKLSTPLHDVGLIGEETTPLALSTKEELDSQPVVGKTSTYEEQQTDLILLNVEPGASPRSPQDAYLRRKETPTHLPSVEKAKPTQEAEAAMCSDVSPDMHAESAVLGNIFNEDSIVEEEDRIECSPVCLAESTTMGNMEKGEQVVTPVTPKDASPSKQRCETAEKSPCLPRSPHLDSQGMDLTFLSQLPYSMRSEARLAFAVNGPRSGSRSHNMCMDKWMASKKDAPSVLTASQMLPTDIDPLVWSELPEDIRQSIKASMQGPARCGGQQRDKPAKRKGGISSFFSATSKRR